MTLKGYLSPPSSASAVTGTLMPQVHVSALRKRSRPESEASSPPLRKRHCTRPFLKPSSISESSSQASLARFQSSANCRKKPLSPLKLHSIARAHHRHNEYREGQQEHIAVILPRIKTSSELQRWARHGGPDLSDLRGYQRPSHSIMSQSTTESGSRKRPSTDNSSTRSSKKPSPYHRNFQQKLIDGGVYPHAYRYPNGKALKPPANWDTINATLAKSRASLSPSRFSLEAFEQFVQADSDAFKEGQVIKSVIPTIEGKVKDGRCVAGGVPLTNLDNLTDSPIAPGNTDHFYGARPEQLNRSVREELYYHIVPAIQEDLPLVPNFFLAVKGPDGTPSVMNKQACYDGALGARGIHSLQMYGQEQAFDECAYTFTSTYQDGQLKMFTSHPTKPDKTNEPPKYYMTQINTWGMTGNAETFRQGATWFRNGRDLAEKWRNEFIDAANERVANRDNNVCSQSVESSNRGDTSASLLNCEGLESETSQDESCFYDAKEDA